MSACQILPCGKLSMLSECLRSVRAETNVCIVACVTNFLTGSEDTGGSVGFRVEPVLLEVLSILTQAAAENPDRAYLLTPPMYRRSPLWYRDGLPEILLKFSAVLKNRPSSLSLMSSFATPEFIDDGVHLTPYSGLEFVLHLFDNAGTVLDALEAGIPDDSRSEATRVLEDRMMSLEQDHQRLSVSLESKTAEDSEKLDYQENIRLEDWIVISGFRRLPEGLSPRDWQIQAKADVSGALKVLMERDIPIIVVKNSTGKGKDAIPTYNVQLQKLGDSKEIRDKFGSFFVGGVGVDRRPSALKAISFKNRVTPETLVRVAILKVLGARYLASNPGAKVQLIHYEPRPVLKLTPPEGAAERRVMSYDFLQAIKMFPVNFSQEERDAIFRRVSPRLFGKLRALFVVISDDMRKRVPPAVSSGDTGNSSRPSGSGGSGSRGSGGSGSRGSRSKNPKRSASSPADGNSEKHRK